MKRRIALISLLLFASAFGAEKRTKSDDGVEFPSAVERVLKQNIPVASDWIGKSPSELTTRVFSTGKSKALLEKRTGYPLKNSWFAWGLADASVVGFDLTDGRISRLELVFNNITEEKLRGIVGQFAKLHPKDASPFVLRTSDLTIIWNSYITGEVARQRFGVIVLEVDQVDWYIRHHEPAQSVVDALRARKLIKGMTAEHGKMLFGEPKKSSDLPEGIKVLEWREYRRRPQQNFSDDLFDPHPHPHRLQYPGLIERGHRWGQQKPLRSS
jgi:hypothetical protein